MFFSKKPSIKSFLLASTSLALITISPLNAKTDKEMKSCILQNSPHAGCSRQCCGNEWDRCDKMMKKMFGRKCCIKVYRDIYNSKGEFIGQDEYLDCPSGYQGSDLKNKKGKSRR